MVLQVFSDVWLENSRCVNVFFLYSFFPSFLLFYVPLTREREKKLRGLFYLNPHVLWNCWVFQLSVWDIGSRKKIQRTHCCVNVCVLISTANVPSSLHLSEISYGCFICNVHGFLVVLSGRNGRKICILHLSRSGHPGLSFYSLEKFRKYPGVFSSKVIIRHRIWGCLKCLEATDNIWK